MAFDYGSIDLGLKNPFKTEGKITAIRGAIQTIAGIALLVIAASSVKSDAGMGWIIMLFGMLILGFGITSLAKGIYATLRFFVGRNHPTSLAYNFSKSETSTAKQEKADVAYAAKTLEEMLIGRKNSTFVEPKGFLSRLLHSIAPKLLFLPYPIRNMSQRLFGAWVSTLTALVLYGVVAFVSLSGFAGDAGELTFPIYSTLLMIYILSCWYSAAKPISRKAEHAIESLGSATLTKVISLSFVLPILIGLTLSYIMDEGKLSKANIELFFAPLPSLHTWAYLTGVIVLALGCSAIIAVMLKARLDKVNPVVEVSELRENWQESVHPNEIFINLDNLVMANRRYKEVPNRVYRELDPSLQEQVDGKGGFKGEMIQEVQPKVMPLDLGKSFERFRFLSLLGGNLLLLVTLGLSVFFAYAVVDIYHYVTSANISNFSSAFSEENIASFSAVVMVAVHLLLSGLLIKSFASMLTNAAHVFYAEMQFESLLVYFKCEGTFTESKISTGTGIHDSTRSENTLVRSSITPWVVVSRIVSTTFAATGMKNLEHPRHILEMHKDDAQLSDIRKDVISFLKDRESIAAITSERDLGNASQVYQLNQQTRAVDQNHQLRASSDEAGAYLRREEALENKEE
ncbi:hypothetical protein DS891_16590 [Pseudoalteromonas sp. JC28]|uniref:hypothetical protein n=1 Tax=Pseudoalteromonas sp. JC28 TaxID=2267617 RepID=UPI001574CD91|nr:hypothetical protein [Pseudoalteromonas sp. JC28]